jgi:hypothetical protein
VLLGLALLVRPFPLLVLVAILVVAWRERRVLPAVQATVGTVLGALVVLVPLATVEPRALTALQQWWGQGAGFGALQIIPQLMGSPLLPGVPVWIAVTGWLLAIGLGVWLGTRPGRAVGIPQLTAVMLLVVALTATSLSVQSGLWVLPLLALSSRPWWEHLVWAFAEAVHFLSTWLHLAFSSDPGRGLPPETYALVIVLRAAAWTWILWRIWEEAPPPGRSRAGAPRPARAPRGEEAEAPESAGVPPRHTARNPLHS